MDGPVVTGLAHAEDGDKADERGAGDVIPDPGDAAVRLQDLRERGRERGAENAAEVVGARRAGIAHGRREQFRQQRAERGEGQSHDAERDAEENQGSAGASREKGRHRQPHHARRGRRREQNGPPADAVRQNS